MSWMTAFVDYPASAAPAGTAFWQGVTASTLSSRRGTHAQFVTLLPAAGDACLRVQTISNADVARVHLDLHSPDRAALTRRATALGARIVHEEDDVTVLTSPGGFAFCTVGWDGEATPPAPVGRSGVSSAVDQLCLDAPPETAADELAFWTSFTGWPATTGRLAAFHRIQVPTRLPIQLLLQRQDAGGRRVSGHLDLAVEAREHETARHVALGADLVSRHEFWSVMADPTGLVYCLTDRLPRRP